MTDFELVMNSDRVDLKQELLPNMEINPTIRANNVPQKGSVIYRITGSLFINNNEGRQYVGTLKPKRESDRTFSSDGDSKDIRLRVEIPSEKLNLIEDIRGSNDPQFSIELDLRYQNRQNIKRKSSATVPDYTTTGLSAEFDVPRSRWIEMLENAGYTELKMFEIPGKQEIGQIPELSEAYEELNEAFKQYRERKNPMPSCRNVIEHLQNSINEADLDETVESMMKDLLSDTHSYLSAGTHTNTENGIQNTDVDGRDHLFAIRMTASCYQRIGEAV